jgi:hypothetical protein
MNNAVCISFVGHAGVTAPIGRCAASRFLQPDGPKKVPCSAHACRGGCKVFDASRWGTFHAMNCPARALFVDPTSGRCRFNH